MELPPDNDMLFSVVATITCGFDTPTPNSRDFSNKKLLPCRWIAALAKLY
jgi:hypothetical protein